MFGIIKRDFMLIFSDIKQRIFMIFIVPFFLLSIDTHRMDWLYFMTIVAVSHSLVLIPFYYDVNNKSASMVASLPISRKEIVIYKYLGVLVYFFMAIVYVGIYLWIINKIGLISVDYFNLSMIKKLIPYILLSMSIILPINFKLGVRYINIVNMIINMGTIMFAFTMASSSAEGNPIQFIKYLDSPIFLLGVVGIFILSMIFSIKLYENKDL